MKTLIYWNFNYTIITETDPTQMAYTFMSLRDKMTKPYFLFLFLTFRESIQVYHRRYTHPSNTTSIYLKTSILHSLSQRNLYIQVSLRQIQIFFSRHFALTSVLGYRSTSVLSRVFIYNYRDLYE